MKSLILTQHNERLLLWVKHL